MKPTLIHRPLQARPTWRLVHVATLVLLGAGLIHTVRAAEDHKQPVTSATNTVANAMTTTQTVPAKAGDTLDKLMAANYKASPLKPEVLRQAVMAANPSIAKPTMRLKPGQPVVLPAHADIVVKTLTPFLPATATAEAPAASDPIARRDWIRYP